MYEVFDGFLTTSTWSKDGPGDRRQFFLLLDKILGNEGFSPESMANHMMQRLRVSPDQTDDYRVRAIRRFTDDACAVKDFLAATSR